MLPPEETRRLIAEAEALLQLEITSVEVDPSEADVARVSARVLSVFRGDESWHGRTVTLPLPLVVEGQVHPPGAPRHLLSRLTAGRILEACVNRGEGGLEVPAGLAMTLDHPTDTAVIPSQQPKPSSPTRRIPWAALGPLLPIAAGLAWLLLR